MNAFAESAAIHLLLDDPGELAIPSFNASLMPSSTWSTSSGRPSRRGGGGRADDRRLRRGRRAVDSVASSASGARPAHRPFAWPDRPATARRHAAAKTAGVAARTGRQGGECGP